MNRRLIATPLALLILAAGLFTFAYSLWIVVHTYSPTFYADQWAVPFILELYGGKFPLHRLWMQHNEHRIPITLIACYLDLIYFGGRSLLLLSLMWISQIAHWALFVYAAYRWGPRDRMLLVALAGFAFYTFFSPIQLDNLIWGFQLQFIQVGLFASLAAACLIAYWRRGESGHSKWLAVAIAAALLSELSLSSGMLIWPVLLVLAIGLRLSRRAFLWIGSAGAAAIAIYMWGFKSVDHHGDVWISLGKPVELGQFVLKYLTYSWDKYLTFDPPSSLLWKTLTIAAVCWVLFEIGRALARGFDRSRAFEPFCYALILFSLSTALLTAVGRLALGQQLAFESRYQTIALAFWLGVAGLAVVRLRSRYWIAQLVLLVLMVRGTTRFARLEAEADARQQTALGAYDTLAKGQYDEQDRYWWLFPNTGAVVRTYQLLAKQHLMPSVHPGPHEYPVVQPIMKLSRGETNFCIGSFDFLYPPSGTRTKWIANGWAWDLVNAKVPDRIVLRNEDGTLAAVVTQTGFARADVIRNAREVSHADVGWRELVDAHPPEKLRAFASRGDGQPECLLGQHAPQQEPH